VWNDQALIGMPPSLSFLLMHQGQVLVVVVMWALVVDATNCKVKYIELLFLLLVLAIVCFMLLSPKLTIGICHCGSFVEYVPLAVQRVLPMFLAFCPSLYYIAP